MKLSDVPGEVAPPAEATPKRRLSDVQDQAAPAEAPNFLQSMLDQVVASFGGRDVSRAGRFGMGVADPAVGTAQLAAHAGPTLGIPFGAMRPGAGAAAEQIRQKAQTETDQFVQQREARYEQGRQAAGDRGVDWMRMGGNVVGSAPLMASPVSAGSGVLARTGIGAATGALGGVTAPVAGGDYWQEQAKRAPLAAAAGGAMGGLGGLLAPALGQDSRALMAGGMRQSQMTPGQRMGAQAGERTLQQFPVLHGFISGLSDRSLGEFNRATVRQALAPIGAIMPRSVQPGHDMIRFADKAVSDAYDRVLPMMAPMDVSTVATAIRGSPQLRALMSELGDDHLRRFESMIDNRVLTRFDPAGQMDGTLFKSVESSLTKLADTYRGTNDAQLVEPLRHLREIVRDQLASSQTDPALSGYLRNTNYAYAMMQRVRDAATRRAGSEAKFTPTDLLTAVRGGDPSTNHAVFGHGDELFQTFAEAANRLMVGRSREMPHVTLTNTATGAALRPAYGAFDAAQRRPMIGGSIMGGAGAAGSVAGEESSPNPRTLRPSVGGP